MNDNVRPHAEVQLAGIDYTGDPSISMGESDDMPQKKDPAKRVFTGVYFDRPQHDALRQLSTTTRVPLAVYLREAVDDLLKKYGVRTARPKGRR